MMMRNDDDARCAMLTMVVRVEMVAMVAMVAMIRMCGRRVRYCDANESVSIVPANRVEHIKNARDSARVGRTYQKENTFGRVAADFDFAQMVGNDVRIVFVQRMRRRSAAKVHVNELNLRTQTHTHTDTQNRHYG